MIYIFNILKYLVLVLDFVLTTFVFLILSFFPSIISRRFFPSLYKIWSLRFFRIFGIREHIHEKYSKPLPKQFILISNHPSGIELLWLPSRFRVIPLAKDEIKHWLFIGRITRVLGTIFVKRQDRESRHAASEALILAAKEGKNIMIFPEGGCYGKRLNPFFMGAFHLSKATGVPIIPAYLHYEEENSYYWGDYGLMRFMVRALFLPKNRNAHLYIFDPFSPHDFKNEAEMHDHIYRFYQDIENKYAL